MGDKPGAVGEAVEAAGSIVPARAEQLPIWPQGVERPAEGEARGRGRPKGARNRRSVEMVEYLTRRYAHPAEGLASIMSRNVIELARELKCKPVDALRVQVDAAKALMPYLAQKQPVAVNVNAAGVVTLVIEAAAGEVLGVGAGDLVDLNAELIDEDESEVDQ